ncbi:MAG: hypothetical protein PGN24_07715 [Microbacterium arborescens]
MYNDYAGPAAAFGIGFVVLGIAIYLGTIALILWVSYLLMRTAVKNGMLLAMREHGGPFPGGYGGAPRPGTSYPPAPPAPGAPGGPAGPTGPASDRPGPVG